MRVTEPKWDTAEKHSLQRNTSSVKGIQQAQEVSILNSRTNCVMHSTKTLWLMQPFVRERWRRARKKHRGKTDRSSRGRKLVKEREMGRETQVEGRRKAWGASMSLQFPGTHVRDPLLPSVWWSVAGAMSIQPGESLHGSQHKSPECSKLRDFATLPPSPPRVNRSWVHYVLHVYTAWHWSRREFGQIMSL